MSNTFKEIEIKNRAYFILDDMNDVKILDSDQMKIDETSYKNIFIYQIKYLMTKDLSYVKIHSINLLKNRQTKRKYEKLWNKIRYFIRSVTNNSENYNKNCMTTKSNSDDENVGHGNSY